NISTKVPNLANNHLNKFAKYTTNNHKFILPKYAINNSMKTTLEYEIKREGNKTPFSPSTYYAATTKLSKFAELNPLAITESLKVSPASPIRLGITTTTTLSNFGETTGQSTSKNSETINSFTASLHTAQPTEETLAVAATSSGQDLLQAATSSGGQNAAGSS
ncbi:unnamed protein product, partial [Meganyctiphanes norvegica]